MPVVLSSLVLSSRSAPAWLAQSHSQYGTGWTGACVSEKHTPFPNLCHTCHVTATTTQRLGGSGAQTRAVNLPVAAFPKTEVRLKTRLALPTCWGHAPFCFTYRFRLSLAASQSGSLCRLRPIGPMPALQPSGFRAPACCGSTPTTQKNRREQERTPRKNDFLRKCAAFHIPEPNPAILRVACGSEPQPQISAWPSRG